MKGKGCRVVRLRGGVAVVALVLVAATGCELDSTDGSAGPREKPAGGGGARYAAAQALTVKGRAPKNNYDRGEFGSAWADTDSNSCDTRDDILKRDLDDVKFRDDDCTVVSGVLDPDPYTGEDVPYVRGRSKIDVDHIVALSDAWQKGAQQWDDSKRIAMANDPLNLLAVDSGTNRGKGDADRPPGSRRQGLPLHLMWRPGRREDEVRPLGHLGRAGRHGARPDHLSGQSSPPAAPDEGPSPLSRGLRPPVPPRGAARQPKSLSRSMTLPLGASAGTGLL